MSANLFSIEGKKVVLTGAQGFLGSHISRALRAEGAVVIGIDKLPPQDENQFQCDITDQSALLQVRTAIEKRFGDIDVLINNAAFNPAVEKTKSNTSFDEYPLQQWEEELRVNLTGPMLVCQTFHPLMRSGTSIINIASIYAVVAPDQRIYPDGFEKPASYGASKAGVINLTKYLAALWGKNNIRVNAVVFGGVENGQNSKFIEQYGVRTPLGRMAQPHEIPGIILFLASDASSYATGATFTVDGGLTAW